MVTIAAPRAWALGTLRQRSWMSHVLTAGTWPWRCCAADTSSLDVGVSPLLCPLCKVREDEEQVLLVAPYWPNRTWFPELMLLYCSPSLANSSEEGSTFSERGHPLAPAPRLVESPRMVLGRDAEVLSGLPPAVVNTITSARALSTRQAYRLK